MKLIIDVPERYYEFCRECVSNRTDTVDQQFIANGTPYEERPHGKWIKITKNGTIPVEYICSVCGRKIFDNYELQIPQSEFYPYCHCGADMREGQDNDKAN